MLSKNQMIMFLKTQMLCIIVNNALMSYVLTVIDFRLKVKEIKIWNLSKAILSKLNIFTHFQLLFQFNKKIT